jgi:hypothetical protein
MANWVMSLLDLFFTSLIVYGTEELVFFFFLFS